MSVTSSTDPVKTIIDLLDNASASDWTNATPDHIERWEETMFNIKTNRNGTGLYLWQATDGDKEQMGANYDHYREDEIVQIDIWDRASSTAAYEYLEDVETILFGYATDNYNSTEWGEIAPIGETDSRAQKRNRDASHYITALQCKLHARRTP